MRHPAEAGPGDGAAGAVARAYSRVSALAASWIVTVRLAANGPPALRRSQFEPLISAGRG